MTRWAVMMPTTASLSASLGLLGMQTGSVSHARRIPRRARLGRRGGRALRRAPKGRVWLATMLQWALSTLRLQMMLLSEASLPHHFRPMALPLHPKFPNTPISRDQGCNWRCPLGYPAAHKFPNPPISRDRRCNWRCPLGYPVVDGVCSLCRIDKCAIGGYRSGCTAEGNGGSCLPCTGKPKLATYSTPGFPFDQDKCEWICYSADEEVRFDSFFSAVCSSSG